MLRRCRGTLTGNDWNHFGIVVQSSNHFLNFLSSNGTLIGNNWRIISPLHRDQLSQLASAAVSILKNCEALFDNSDSKNCDTMTKPFLYMVLHSPSFKTNVKCPYKVGSISYSQPLTSVLANKMKYTVTLYIYILYDVIYIYALPKRRFGHFGWMWLTIMQANTAQLHLALSCPRYLLISSRGFKHGNRGELLFWRSWKRSIVRQMEWRDLQPSGSGHEVWKRGSPKSERNGQVVWKCGVKHGTTLEM